MNNIYFAFLKRISASAKSVYLGAACVLFSISANAQACDVTSGQTAAYLTHVLTGPGVITMNQTLTCTLTAEGTFSIVAGASAQLGFDSGIILTNGLAASNSSAFGANINNNNSAGNDLASTINGTPGDPDLNVLSGNQTHDACVLEFDLKPSGDSISFNYVFGSEEYTNYTCSQFNDVFGFFVSGPGIAGGQGYINNAENIALIPGTNIPVEINTVNCGATGGLDSTYCAIIIGPTYPYCGYFVNNNSGTVIAYDGLTTVLTATARNLNPCDTYHIKIGVADAGSSSVPNANVTYDSGVFLKAGSLTSPGNSVVAEGSSTGGTASAVLPYIVRGCPNGGFVFNLPSAVPAGDTLTLRYNIGGTAVNGYDYAQVADSVMLYAGATTDTLYIDPLAVTPAGPKSVQVYLYAQYSCNGVPNVIDSASIIIYDSFNVHILTPDTAVCIGQDVHIIATQDTTLNSLLTYSWSPATNLDNSTILSPTTSTSVTTTYYLSAFVANSSCPVTHGQIKVTIDLPPVVGVGATDLTTCLGTPVQLSVYSSGVDTPFTYLWTPTNTVSDDTAAHPYANPTGETTYTVTVSPKVANCSSTDTVHVHVLPNDFIIFNHDSSICKGYQVQIYAYGDTLFSYNWYPQSNNSISNTNIIDPTITPDTTSTYYVTATYPGCTEMTHQITFYVQPNPLVYLGGDRSVCYGDTLHFNSYVQPTWYNQYIYMWSPGTNLSDSTSPDVIFYANGSSESLKLTVTTQAGCTGSDSSYITVHNGPHSSVTPLQSTVCPDDSVQFFININGNTSATYHWSPDFGIDSTTASPFAHPTASTNYDLIVTNEWGCNDSFQLYINVRPAAVVGMPDSVAIYPGESYQINPQTNCTTFSWFPPLGLSDSAASNPLAMPPVNTEYFVHASTEWGCSTTDSIKVYVDPTTLLALPNGFTPGNGPNNEFKIIKRGIATLKYFRIFNRWGEKMYETSNIDNGWDGTYSGQPQPMGVYVYEVQAYTSDGHEFTKQGNVTLIR